MAAEKLPTNIEIRNLEVVTESDVAEMTRRSATVPDPDWVHVDNSGDEHRWKKAGNNVWHLPTLIKNVCKKKVMIDPEPDYCCCCGRDRNDDVEPYESEVVVNFFTSSTGEVVKPGYREESAPFDTVNIGKRVAGSFETEADMVNIFKAAGQLRFFGVGTLAHIKSVIHIGLHGYLVEFEFGSSLTVSHDKYFQSDTVGIEYPEGRR